MHSNVKSVVQQKLSAVLQCRENLSVLTKLNLETLEERRTRARLAMAYKILNGLVILEPDMLPKFRHSKMRSCNSAPVGYQNQLIEPQATLHVTESTFFYSIPEIWNQRVTEQQAKSPSVDAFKAYFDKE